MCTLAWSLVAQSYCDIEVGAAASGQRLAANPISRHAVLSSPIFMADADSPKRKIASIVIVKGTTADPSASSGPNSTPLCDSRANNPNPVEKRTINPTVGSGAVKPLVSGINKSPQT